MSPRLLLEIQRERDASQRSKESESARGGVDNDHDDENNEDIWRQVVGKGDLSVEESTLIRLFSRHGSHVLSK